MKPVGEREDLAIPVSNNRYVFIKILLFTLLVFGCSPSRVTVHQKIVQLKPLSSEDSIDYDYYFIEGTKQKLLGNLAGSVLLFNSALKIDPFSAAVCYQLSQIYYSTRNISKALNYGRYAVRYDDTNSVYKVNLARLFKEEGKTDSSLFYYRQIVAEKLYNFDK